MKLGICGGTFNPIHYGHLRTAEEVRDKLSLDKILFIPAGRPPFEKSGLIRASHRYKMVKLAIADNPCFEVSDIEVKMKGKSFTVDTIRKLGEKYKGSELFFILGIDAFLDLPHWKQPDKLVSLTNMIIISRPGYSFTGLVASPYLGEVRKKTLKELDEGRKSVFSFGISGNKKGFLCRVTPLDTSASAVRNLIISGKSVKYLLPDSVESYIISHKLYKDTSRSLIKEGDI
ncbi:MAG: nicotinate-nucleotide adenylyltransferase [Nitrospiraceae bacterium]|nr:MAG: nicotinate-nucleotide adenylyltransferase [Nitrospiraceae bacterium]